MKERKVQSIELFGPRQPLILPPPKECPELRQVAPPPTSCAPVNDAGATGDRGLYLFSPFSSTTYARWMRLDAPVRGKLPTCDPPTYPLPAFLFLSSRTFLLVSTIGPFTCQIWPSTR